MKNTHKKAYLAITSVLMAMTAQIHAADCNKSPCKPAPKPCNPEPRCAPRCEDSCKPSRYCGIDCNPAPDEINIRADLLYWRAELCGLEAAFGSTAIATSVAGGIITTTVTESDKEPDFDWRFGFRVGADLEFNRFDLDAIWTHYEGGAHFKDHGSHGRWKIKYDVIDLTIGRRFCMSPCFWFKPFIGVRSADIHQSLHSDLSTFFTAIIGNNTVFTRKHDKEDFWGIGPELGVEADWHIGCNFSIYASIDVVTYYGEVKGKNFDTDTFTSTVSVCNGKNKHCFDSLATDGAIGIRWDKSWDCYCYAIDFMAKLGAEQHRIYDFSDLGSDGTLSLDGGIFEIGIGFRY